MAITKALLRTSVFALLCLFLAVLTVSASKRTVPHTSPTPVAVARDSSPQEIAYMGAPTLGCLEIIRKDKYEEIYLSGAEVFGSYASRYTQCLTEANDSVFRLPETGSSGFHYLPLAMLLCAAPIFINTKTKTRKGETTA